MESTDKSTALTPPLARLRAQAEVAAKSPSKWQVVTGHPELPPLAAYIDACDPKLILSLLDDLAALRGIVERLTNALADLAGDANRLCDRGLGGTYEEDCRVSIEIANVNIQQARAALVRDGERT